MGHIFFATLKSLYLCGCFLWQQGVALWWQPHDAFDVAVVDQLATPVPILKLFLPALPVLFYCHFPDRLLAKPGGYLKRCYRRVVDALESVSLRIPFVCARTRTLMCPDALHVVCLEYRLCRRAICQQCVHAAGVQGHVPRVHPTGPCSTHSPPWHYCAQLSDGSRGDVQHP